VHYLLQRQDLDVNFQSRHGENALLESVTYRKHDIAKQLLTRRDLEPDVLDFRDRTPLVMAVQYGYAHLVRLILIAGADPTTGAVLDLSEIENHMFYILFYILFSDKSHKTIHDSSDFQLQLRGE
jgi:ankyrin repeat protein